MLMPARVEATLTDEQTRRVSAIAWGMASIRAASCRVKPFWTMAEKPPTKSMPTSAAAASRAWATATKSSLEPPATTSAIGVTDTRRLTIGTPYFSWISRATGTSRPARATILSWMRSQTRPTSREAQSFREMPMVTARTSRFWSWIMRTVSRISSLVMKTMASRRR